ncbi:sialate O-acetylesterase [Pontiella sp.]|uniref:sialate O-acetylesterase n=1 Tax=Pontiella sp. TaxID=2837462 RepID=UPI00356A0596
MKRIIGAVLALCFTGVSSWAELQLPRVFADHMVLQRGQDVPLWGTADPGAEIVAEFAGQKRTAVADKAGKWRVDFQSLEASAESRVLTVSAGDERIRISDVLVGEVWLCGGQSNMDFSLNMLKGKARDPQYEPVAEYLRKEIQSADDPLFRQFKVGRQVSAYEALSEAAGVWKLAVPGQVQEFSGTGYFFGRELRRELGVPVALLSCNWGGTLVEPWIPAAGFQASDAMKSYYDEQLSELKNKAAAWDEAAVRAKYEKQLAEWKVKADAAEANGKKAPRKPRMAEHPERSNRIPATLYNGMLHSLVPYGIKGVIWYQGESNRAHYPEAYAERFSVLIDSWRERFEQDDLYFYWCQLAKYTDPVEQPVGDEDGWVTVIDAQRRVTAKPNTGMAVLNDIGEAKDIHPKNKVDVGRRLSLWALDQAYGRELVCSGPLYRDSEIRGNKVVVRFDYAGSGLMAGRKHLLDPAVEVDEPLKRFQICGADGVWQWATAEISGPDEVTVWHADIPQPVEVRYAWAANAEGANLYNREGLPASVFKTR